MSTYVRSVSVVLLIIIILGAALPGASDPLCVMGNGISGSSSRLTSDFVYL